MALPQPALDLELGKTAVVSRHHHVGGQHQLQPQGEGDALHRHHHGLGAAAQSGVAQVQRVYPAIGAHALAALHGLGHAGQIQTSGEVLAQRMQHTHAQAGFVFQPGVSGTEFAQHHRGEAIALGHAVDADAQNGTAYLAHDATLGVVRHGGLHSSDPDLSAVIQALRISGQSGVA